MSSVRKDTSLSQKAFTLEDKVSSFWEKVDRSGGPDACWNWQGAITAKWGYGCFGIGGNVTRGAHKLAWLFTHGNPNGLCVLHRCDNRLCCNPAHLFLGTKMDNHEDMVAKGRKQTILTPADVREIRAAVAPYKGRKRLPVGMKDELAKKYGVSGHAIYHVVSGKQWKHVQ